MPHSQTELLSPEQFSLLREAIERMSGIVLGAGKVSHLDSVVRERMAATGETVAARYVERVIADSPSGGERKALVTTLLVGETSFFRTPALYDILQRKLFPEIRSAGAPFPLRIWSAGCATGEEAYSLAIAALEAFGAKSADPVRILATDLHTGFLDVAQEGIYPVSALRDASPLLVSKYFRLLPDGRFRVADEVRRLVTFEHRNLTQPFPRGSGHERFAAILCRNVMIYFRPETTRKVVASFHERLAEEGLFFLGHSETLWGISDDFRLEERDGVFFYRKRDASQAVARAVPARHDDDRRKRARGPAAPPQPRPAPAISAARAVVPPSAAFRVAPAAPPSPPPHAIPAADAVALAMVQRAEKLIDADRVEEAAAACREAIACHPGCVEGDYLLAVLLRRQGRCGEALAHAARTLLVDPLFVQGAVEIAECLDLLGRTREAEGHWQALLDLLDKPVHFPRLSPATGMTAAALRDYVAARLK
jgi:chemotaxis protein methyltransferase CheR